MALDNINIGSSANDGTGDTIRDAFGKVNTNNTKTLTNDVADYSSATTPLSGTELALIEQGGTFKKVAVSNIGGISSEDIGTYFKGDLYMCQATGGSLSNFGYAGNPTLVGTGSNVSANLSADYTTAPYQTWTYRRQQSSAIAGNNASATWGWKNVSCGLGFYASSKVNIDMTTNGRFLLGLTDSTLDIGNVNPSTLTNILGFGIDSLDANLQVLHNDNTGIATKVDLGSDFSINATSNNTYLLEIWNFKGSSIVYFRIKNLLTNVTSAIIEVTTDVPTVTDGLAFHLWSNNGTDASLITMHFSNHILKRQS